jgi:hypothetical protein
MVDAPYKSFDSRFRISVTELWISSSEASIPRRPSVDSQKWRRILRSPHFSGLKCPCNSTPTFSQIFHSPFPSLVFDLLNSTLSEPPPHREYFFTSFAKSDISDRLEILTEAVLLLSEAPLQFISGFQEFDSIGLLIQILRVDRIRSAENALRAISNFSQILPIPPEYVESLIDYFSSLPFGNLKSLALFSLSSIAGFDYGPFLVDRLFAIFSALATNAGFFQTCVRGISRLSSHHPNLLIENQLMSLFVDALDPENEFLTGYCLVALRNIVSEVSLFPPLIEKFLILIRSPPSRATLHYLHFMTALSVSVPDFAHLIAENHLEHLQGLRPDSVLAAAFSYIDDGAIDFRIASLEFLVSCAENSAEIRDGIYSYEFIGLVGSFVDSIDSDLAIRLIQSIATKLAALQRSERDEYISELRDIAENVEPEVGAIIGQMLDEISPSIGW